MYTYSLWKYISKHIQYIQYIFLINSFFDKKRLPVSFKWAYICLHVGMANDKYLTNTNV